MRSTKNIILGKIKFLNIKFYFYIFFFLFFFIFENNADTTSEKKFIEIKILDKVSSKSTKLAFENGKEIKFKNLLIKSLKCKNSEFDDNPEITAYLQVKDSSNTGNNEVFVFNGWTFSSSPSLRPFDHPVYDIWLLKCY